MTEHEHHTTTLASALRAAGAELAAQQPPPALQARIKAALPKARAAAEPASSWRSGWVWSGAAAFATMLLGTALLVLRPAPPLLVDDGLRFGAFVRVAPAERWPAGETQAWLVRTEMPEERLAALGLPYDPARAGESVRAELLMHPSGEVLAVRFVP
jgi:hypothetical protein